MTKEVTAAMAEQALHRLMWYANMGKSNEPDDQRNTRIVESSFVIHDFIKDASK